MTRKINVVPHTHWDREWYLTFEEFRDKLVTTLDLVLEILATDDSWSHFHLDGQTAMIDDYLAVRPERGPEIERAVRAGRLSCGPWVTLVDEFLVSGESILRNLEDGVARASELGGKLVIAYLPDQFGHVGQMPQILASHGFDTVIVWRGVPSAVDRSSFRWIAPDGSEVTALYLPFGYGQGARLPKKPRKLRARLSEEVARTAPFLTEGEPLLLMAGDDHALPEPRLTDALAKVGGAKITSLADHVKSVEPPEQTWTGELRSAARANLLPNTYSVRPLQKLERARAEIALERYAEPLAALVEGEPWPEAELKEAWMLLHLNGAHDSVCGCSTDEVAEAVDERTRRATAIAAAITDRALVRLAQQNTAGAIVFNPSPFERHEVPSLGWAAGSPPAIEPLPLEVRDDRILVPSRSGVVSIRLQDVADVGDLYTFCPDGPASWPHELTSIDGTIRVRFDRFDATLHASAAPHEPFSRLAIDIDNRSPDHRVQLLVDLPRATHKTLAGSVFELVERGRFSEGGSSEPPSTCWPARGFVVTGDVSVLSEGVFEYELVNEKVLAVTLIRCVGTISRKKLATRAVTAGPDVPTPGAQTIGKTRLEFGVLGVDPGEEMIQIWERYALPLVGTSGPGTEAGGSGRLLDLDVPALSSVRKHNGSLAVRVWNPSSGPAQTRLGTVDFELPPHRIETITLD